MLLDPGFNLTLRPMRYPDFYEMYRNAIKNTWTVEEVDFSTDVMDLKAKMTASERHLINRLVAFFATGDSIVSNNLVLNLYKHINAPEARMYQTIVQMPEGYDTQIGEAGGSLSGGQRQRLAIARALIRNPPVLVLDEATSALDPASESAIHQTVSDISLGRTVISVTHRLAQVTDVDRIFVFDNGKLVAQGKHESLRDAGGIYTELWRKQSGVEVSTQGSDARVHPEWLHEFPLFQHVSDPVLQRVADELIFERKEENGVVFEEGAPGEKFYIVARGKVEVIREGKRLAVLTDGDFFGEIALVRDAPRNATVRTLVPCLFLTLTQSRFQKLLNEEEELRSAIARTVTARLEAI